MYKIRINCTSKADLTFNGEKINKKIANAIMLKLQPENIEYVSSVIILHKRTSDGFITKTFEFLCKYQINETQFVELIDKMKQIGFYTENKKNKIQLMDMTDAGNIIYNYYFKSEKSASEPKKQKNKNKSTYSQMCLYKSI